MNQFANVVLSTTIRMDVWLYFDFQLQYFEVYIYFRVIES